MVDNIEQALTSTDELVHEAAEHVKTTVKIKKRTKRLKWILISFFICLIILIIIIIYFTLKLAIPYG
jgi:t-SNARE complex subunit (syntaxin)